jgi:hypothetical protein
MPFVDAARNEMLDALTDATPALDPITSGSLHTADPTAGANEVTGGSPAYARKAVTFANAASGAALQNGTDPVFDVPASTTVVATGYWSDTNEFKGWSPLNGGTVFPFYATDAGDLFSVDGHGYSNDFQVYVYAITGSSLPTGLAEGTRYYIITVSGDTFQLSATQGGGAIAISSDGAGFIQRVIPETFGVQGTLTITDATLRLVG